MERCYEAMLIINPELAQEERKGIIQKIEKIVDGFQGKILSIEEWGNKSLAYAIQRFLEGYYIQINFSGLSQAVKEIERVLKLDEKVLRYQTMRVWKDIK